MGRVGHVDTGVCVVCLVANLDRGWGAGVCQLESKRGGRGGWIVYKEVVIGKERGRVRG